MSPNGSPNNLRAAQACISCRKQKRKCDKTLPGCSLCMRMSRPCDYSDSTPTPTSEDFATLQKKVSELESRLSQNSPEGARWETLSQKTNGSGDISMIDTLKFTKPPSFPSSFFLDTEMFKSAGLSICRPLVSIPQEISSAIGSMLDTQDIVDRYFTNIHTWLPIVSRKRMTLTLQNPQLDPSADLALLILSMKLITQEVGPNSRNCQSPLYWTVKRYIMFVESSALLSLQLLQATVLTAAYEIGHAIYPAAYLTTGQCARLGTALGLNDRKHACQVLKRSGAWTEVEEIKRVWWATMLLDRCVNLGSPSHPLVTEDPSRGDVLPADDLMWDEGEMTTSEPLYVSSPTSVGAGSFARTCQATHLMGRLIRLMNDNTLESRLRFTEGLQLYRTLTALGKVLLNEVQQAPTTCSTSLGLCYAAILHLCDPFACTESNRGEHTVEETDMQAVAIAGLKSTAAEILQFSQLIKIHMTVDLAATSPLLADCLYQAAATYAWLTYESGSPEMASSYSNLKEMLIIMDARWKVGGEYLKILDLAREHLYADSPLL